MISVNDWRISLCEIEIQEGYMIPAGVMIKAGDFVAQCDQILFDESSQSHKVLIGDNAYNLGHPHREWSESLALSGLSPEVYLGRARNLLNGITKLNRPILH